MKLGRPWPGINGDEAMKAIILLGNEADAPADAKPVTVVFATDPKSFDTIAEALEAAGVAETEHEALVAKLVEGGLLIV
jgi:hypothetical protein